MATLPTTIQLPLSKSISNRVLILQALSQGQLKVPSLAQCDDTDVLLKALHSTQPLKDIGAAGTSMRFLTAYYAQSQEEVTLTGSARMKQRPIQLLVEALRSCGAEISYLEQEGFPPLAIKGVPLQGGHVVLDGSVSSQYISALLMIAPLMEQGLTLELTGKITSEPYLKMTLSLMEEVGITHHRDGNLITISPQSFTPLEMQVEADWSAASYWYEMVALHQELKVELIGLTETSSQGDAQLATYFQSLGVKTTFTEKGVILEGNGSYCTKLELNLEKEPDIAQTLAVTCALLDIPFHFSGLHTLRIKETDRLTALKNELTKLGYVLEIIGDHTLTWNKQYTEATPEPIIATYDDHRMAMAFAPACLKINSIRIEHPLVVTKSYPTYYKDLKSIGFEIKEESI